MKPPTFGGDPEVFIKTSDGKAVPPIALLPEAKTVVSLNACGGANRDGVAFELNPYPDASPEIVFSRIRSLLAEGMKRFVDMGLTPCKDVEVEIESGLQPDLYEFGCSPDFNAYTRAQNVVSVDARVYLKRHAGGHITMGLPEELKLKWEDVCELVKLMDYWVGLPSLRWSQQGSIERRRVYGAAGCFRWNAEKRIVEYRTPDTGWLWNNGYVEMCVGMRRALTQFLAGARLTRPKAVIAAINNCDLEAAKELIGQ